MTTKQRIEAARQAGWTHIRTERSYADGIPPGFPPPHPFGAHHYQELPVNFEGLCCTCGGEVVEIRPGKHQCDHCENVAALTPAAPELLKRCQDLEQERDRLRILAGELIAVIRINVMRGSFTDVTTEDLDGFLAPFVERLSPNPNQPQP
jgi:hypothetical protein